MHGSLQDFSGLVKLNGRCVCVCVCACVCVCVYVFRQLVLRTLEVDDNVKQ